MEFGGSWQNCEHNGGKGQLPRRRLHKWTMRRWHSLAAIHGMVTHLVVMVRRAMHCLAALHRLCFGRHGLAVEGIRPESDCEYGHQEWLAYTHYRPI
jgi:hypothetical protein